MRYPVGGPALSLSTRASGLLSLPTLMGVAQTAHLAGLDLDLSRRVWLVRPQEIVAATQSAELFISSLWAPRIVPGPFARERGLGAAELGASLATAVGADLLVLDRPPHGPGWANSAAVELVEAVRGETGNVAIAIALRPRDLQGTRDHLAQVAALRRAAEEWDFEIALDLLGPIDCRWEAEAAVARLLPRLRLIRTGSLAPLPPGRSRAAMTARAINAAVDSGFRGMFALAPSLPIWRRCRADAVAEAATDTTRRLLARYAAVHDQTRLDSYRQFRESS